MEKLYDWLTGFTIKKNDFDYENQGKYSPYIINRFVSMSNMHIEIVNAMNQIGSLVPKDAHYNYYKCLLPQAYHKFTYIRDKKSKNLDKDEAIECIKKYYEITTKEALIYYNQMEENEINFIVNKYKHGVIKR